MGDKPLDDGTEPSLELPHLFGRKKKADPEPAPEPKLPKVTKQKDDDEWDEEREFKLPAVPGRAAAILTGLIVGVLGAVLTWGSLQACESFKGTDSCGGQGFFLLLVVLLLMVLAGGALLAAWEVADPRSTSALGVGIVCVLILLLLMEELLDGWMFLVVPVVSAVAYAMAHWVTTALVDETALAPDREQHDIR
jgi:hypothetical protein